MADTLFFAAMSFYGWSVGSGLDRSGKVAGDGNRTRRHIYIPRNYAAAAQLRGGVKTPPYSTCLLYTSDAADDTPV